MSCDKPFWSITTGIKSGVWSTITLRGKEYIAVDGVPTYYIDGTPIGEANNLPPLSETLEASLPKAPAGLEYPSWIGDYVGYPEPMTVVEGIPGPQGPPGVKPEQFQEVEETITDHDIRIYQLEGECDALQSKVNRLERLIKNKLDKPSVAQELIDAEAYMDDYLTASRRFKRDRHARKQRINTKLRRISRITKESKMKRKTSRSFVIAGSALVAIGALASFVAIACLAVL